MRMIRIWERRCADFASRQSIIARFLDRRKCYFTGLTS